MGSMKVTWSSIIFFTCFATLWSLSKAGKAKKWRAAINEAITSLISKVNGMDGKIEDLIEAYEQSADEATICPDGWNGFQNSCYLFVATKMTWAAAMEHCQSLVEGGHLAEVDSGEKDSYLTDLLKWSGGSEGAWIGATDARKEGQWRWVMANKTAQYLDWCQIEPNGGLNENCLHFNYLGGNCWVDNTCYATVSSICEVVKTK